MTPHRTILALAVEARSRADTTGSDVGSACHTSSMAAIDWGKVWDWFAQPEVSIPVFALAVGIAYQQGTPDE